YEINGPLFFGAAQKAMDALSASRIDTYQVLVLSLGKVPVIDATGLAALENAIHRMLRRKKSIIVAGPLPRPHDLWEKVDLPRKYPGIEITRSLETPIAKAAEIARS